MDFDISKHTTGTCTPCVELEKEIQDKIKRN